MTRYPHGLCFLLIAGVAFSTLAAEETKKLPHVTLNVPPLNEPVTIDGRLEEPCYARHASWTGFVDAASPNAPIPVTRAWLFWSTEHLTVAFECADTTLAARGPTQREKDVDPQDRVELFLWSGREGESYYCLELAPGGALHDYQARFYRKFDDAWSALGLEWKATHTSTGYIVEARISKQGVAAMGLTLRDGERWQGGLFRADFDRLDGTPTWISWIPGRTAQPDFHVAEMLGTFQLVDDRDP